MAAVAVATAKALVKHGWELALLHASLDMVLDLSDQARIVHACVRVCVKVEAWR